MITELKIKSPGQRFVEHYPSMFTNNTEWWAQRLDEHFKENEKFLTKHFTKKVNIQKEISAEKAILFCVQSGYIDVSDVERTVKEIFNSYIQHERKIDPNFASNGT